MANIGTFNNQEGAIFNDNSVTINAQQNNTKLNIETQTAIQTDEKMSNPKKELNKLKPICLNPDIDKIDFIRIINAMCEIRMFTTPNGLVADKKDVFSAFGAILNQNFSRFSNNLNGSVGTSSTNNNKATEKIFDNLKSAALKFNQRVIDNKQK